MRCCKIISSWLVQEMDICQWDEQDFSLEIDIKNCIAIGAWVKSRQFRCGKILTHYNLCSRKRPPPISDHLGLTFWVVAYGRFHCISKTIHSVRVFRRFLLWSRDIPNMGVVQNMWRKPELNRHNKLWCTLDFRSQKRRFWDFLSNRLVVKFLP